MRILHFIKKNILYLAIIIFVGALIYSFNLHNQLFWDDSDWIVSNPFVHSLSWTNVKNWLTQNTLAGIGLKSNYYRPFLFFTFTINYVLGGESPLGYHLINNALHIANGLLIFALISALFRRRLVAFFVALFFVVHPLQTEAVTYVAGRGDPLNVFFMLTGLLLFLWAEKRAAAYLDWRRIASMLALILAFLSRETAIVFPFLALLTHLTVFRSNKLFASVKRAFVATLPYFIIVFIYGILRLTVLNFENTLNFYAKSNPYTEHLSYRLYTFLSILLTYARLLIAPLGLHMERTTAIFTSFFFAPVVVSVVILGGIMAGLRYLYTKGSRFREDVTVLLFGLGWFFINLGPTSGITPINAQIYEHWLYLAMVGPLTIVFFYAHRLITRRPQLKIAIIIGAVGVAAWFSVLAIQRNILWGKPIEFYLDILKYEPDSVRISNNLGNLYFDKGEHVKAEEYYWKAVKIDDNFPQPHYNLGSILQARKDIRGAIVEYEKAIQIDPNFHFAYQNLAIIYAGQGNLSKTEQYLRKLLELRPDDARNYFNLGRVLLIKNEMAEATELLRKALVLAANDPEVRKEIVKILEVINK